MKILVTGFAPFGKEKINPSYEAVKRLPDKIQQAEIVKAEIPTTYIEDGHVLERLLETHQPDFVLCIGQAGRRTAITVEKVAINLMEARIPDNGGNQPLDKAIVPDGETAYFATLPVKAIVQKIRSRGIPAEMSYSAGTFVCNDLMYRLLYLAAVKFHGLRGGFIHVPFLPEQVLDKPNAPSMSLEMMVAGLTATIEALLAPEETNEPMGELD
ncbi:MAG: pyroglutamyl-peptidase I [Enterococcaceae bacterium]|jgi:pyroglutamyl-peptidase|nr:pyroglutamyl-peptidase I [Enterococcaceae bacterium]MCI1918617.1 pyroglutamyl-peptidase I [Enterococcaceae bacterium]